MACEVCHWVACVLLTLGALGALAFFCDVLTEGA